jgi:hypothetical protein
MLGFRLPQIDAFHMGDLAGKLTRYIIIIGLV